MWTEMGNHGWGWMVFGGIHMVVFWVLIALMILALVRWLSKETADNDTKVVATAQTILQQRYARGEIEREEYNRVKADLES